VPLILGDVTATPDLTALPGSNVLQQIVNGAAAFAARGRMAALISAASALVVGAAPGLVNFFQHLGASAK